MNRKTFLTAGISLFSFQLSAANKKKKKKNNKKKNNNNKEQKSKYDYRELSGTIIHRKEGLNENLYLQSGNKNIYIASTIHDEVEEFLNQNVTLKAKINRDRIIAIKEVKLASKTKKEAVKKKEKKKK